MRKLLSKILVIVILLSFSVGSAWAAEVEPTKDILTLDEAKELVLKNARALKSTEKQIDIIEAQSYSIYNAYAGLKRQLNSQYTLEKLNEIQNAMSQIEGREGFDPNSPPADWYNLSLQKMMLQSQLQQTNSIGISQIEQMRLNYERARDGLADAKRAYEDLEKTLSFSTEKLYTTILNLENTLQILEKQYDAAMNKVKALRLQQELGMVTADLVKNTEVAASNLAQSIKSLKDLLQKSKWTLNDLMGRDPDSNLQLVGFTVEGPFPTENYEIVLEQALANNAELPKLERQLRYYDQDGNYTDDSNDIRVLSASIDRTKLSIEDLKQSLKESVKVLVTNHEAKAKNYQLANVNLNTAKQTYEWAKKKYELGIISKLDFEDAEIAYQQKLNEKVNAGYEYMLARNALELAKQGIIDSQYVATAQASLAGGM